MPLRLWLCSTHSLQIDTVSGLGPCTLQIKSIVQLQSSGPETQSDSEGQSGFAIGQSEDEYRRYGSYHSDGQAIAESFMTL